MATDKPAIEARLNVWEDGKREYGMHASDGDFTRYILARKRREYSIKREEGDDEQTNTDYAYELYHPDEITVEKYNALIEDGYHVTELSDSEFVERIHSAFSDL